MRLKLEAECTGTNPQCCDLVTTLPSDGSAVLKWESKDVGKELSNPLFLLVTPHVLHQSNADRVMLSGKADEQALTFPAFRDFG